MSTTNNVNDRKTEYSMIDRKNERELYFYYDFTSAKFFLLEN